MADMSFSIKNCVGNIATRGKLCYTCKLNENEQKEKREDCMYGSII